KFIESGNKVKVVCRLRGREITHPEIATQQLELIVQGVEDVANVEQRPTMEARTMALLLAPKPQVMQRIQNEKAQRDRQAKRPEDGAEEPDLDDDDDDDDDDSVEEGSAEAEAM